MAFEVGGNTIPDRVIHEYKVLSEVEIKSQILQIFLEK